MAKRRKKKGPSKEESLSRRDKAAQGFMDLLGKTRPKGKKIPTERGDKIKPDQGREIP